MATAIPYLSPLVQWYHQQDRQLPWRQHFQKTKDPYGVWVSEVMLQQTLIKVVIPVYARFMAKFPTLFDLAQASDDDLRESVRGLGYYRRFRMMHACAKHLVQARQTPRTEPEDLRELWPSTALDLKKLPGIGDYTSAAIASIAFGEKVAVLDGNVERVLCRLQGLSVQPKEPATKKHLSTLAQDYLNHGYKVTKSRPLTGGDIAAGDHNQAMMELGQLVCTPLRPQCPLCPLGDQCQGYQRGIQDEIPLIAARKATRPISMGLSIVLKSESGQTLVALFQRAPRARFLKGSWGFFSEWSEDPFFGSDSIGPSLGAGLEKSGSFRHSITHHRLAVDVFIQNHHDFNRSSLPHGWYCDSLKDDLKWVPLGQVEPQLVANLDRKAWKVFHKRLTPGKLRYSLTKDSIDVKQQTKAQSPAS